MDNFRDDIINEIINIEDKAQAIITDFTEMENQNRKELENDICKLHDDICLKAEQKIEQIRKTETEYMQSKIEEIISNASHRKKKIDSIFQANKQKWIDTIFDNIIALGVSKS